MNHLPEETHFSNTIVASTFYGMKQCSKCGEKKPLREFNNRQASRDGKQSYCRLCQEDDRLLRAYNLTRQQRDLMYDRQQGQCTSCHRWYPQLYIYAFEGIGVISLVCPPCMRVCNGFNRNPIIITSAIAYLDFFREKVLYGVILHNNEDWEASATEALPRKDGGLANEETYEHWLLWSDHTCYICREPRSTGRKFARDHQHVTNRNRGLLCFLCNTTLGTANDDIDLLYACATFLISYLAPFLAALSLAGCVQITDAMVANA